MLLLVPVNQRPATNNHKTTSTQAAKPRNAFVAVFGNKRSVKQNALQQSNYHQHRKHILFLSDLLFAICKAS